jgi:hypothetical protein
MSRASFAPQLGRRELVEGRTRSQPHTSGHPGMATEAETLLRLQRDAGNAAVADMLTSGTRALGDLLGAGEQLLSKQIAAGVQATENHLTNELFWLEYPSLRGEKLQPGTPEAMRWLRIRDAVVHPLLAARAKPEPSTGWNPPAGKSGPPKDMVPAGQLAAESGGGGGAKQASLDDSYFVQDIGRYQDVNDQGVTRVWMYGSSGMNICNMTTLTMGLVSMAGEAEVRTKIVGLLRSKGLHAGASVQIGQAWTPLAQALDDPKVLDRIALIDLVTAAAIGEHGSYGDVSLPGTIARIARESGLAVKSDTIRGQPRMATEKGRTMAKEMLAAGKRVIAGTINHYVYLLEVNDDSVILHDPAGARVEPGLKGPVFLHGGSANSIAHEWSRLDQGRREIAVRRVSTNSAAAAIVNQLVEIWAMPETERKPAIAQLAKEHPGHIATGARNFYASSEFAAHDLRLCVSLTA